MIFVNVFTGLLLWYYLDIFRALGQVISWMVTQVFQRYGIIYHSGYQQGAAKPSLLSNKNDDSSTIALYGAHFVVGDGTLVVVGWRICSYNRSTGRCFRLLWPIQ